LLQQFPDSRPKVARAMGISRTTLWRKMKKYGIDGAETET
jgi:transcriptional regulator of acetoin/glycerol metabolism